MIVKATFISHCEGHVGTTRAPQVNANANALLSPLCFRVECNY